MSKTRIVSVFLILSLSILGISPETTAAEEYAISNELNVYLIRSITQTEDGYLWISAGQEVLRFDGLEYESIPLETIRSEDYQSLFSRVRSGETTPKDFTDYGISSDQIQAVIEDRMGYLWVGTKSGLHHLSKDANGRIHSENYLNNVDVLSLFEDREGNIWIGTRSSGLKCLKEIVFATHSVSESADSNHFTSLFKDSKGRIWAGTRYGDLYRFEDGHLERVSFETDIFDKFMFTISEDKRGRILFGTEYKGIHVYENGRTLPYMAEEGPVDGAITTLFSDSHDRLWVGWYTEEMGFYENGRYTRFLTSQEYPGKMVFSIIEDRQRNLWMGSTSGVLFLPVGSGDKQNMRWLLKDIAVHSLLEDDSGMIWCGTSENGLIRIHPETFSTVKITRDDGLFIDYVYHILQDNRRNLWLTTYQRIMRFPVDELNALADKKTEKVDGVLFGLSDGLPPPGLDGLVTDEGHLLFVTNDGIAEVDPETVPVNHVPPRILVDRIMNNGRTLEMDHDTPDSLKIRSRSHLEIHFKVITFKGQENIQAKYLLTGFENTWTSILPGQDKTVAFTDLTPGQYTFRITASNNQGIWSEEADYLSFLVVPLFYQTIYFKLGFFLVFLAGTGLLAAFLFKRTQKRKNKYRKTRLPENLAHEYERRLLYQLEKEKIYRDSSLCLKTLSSKLSLPAHHLSQVINDKFHKNFYELVNTYRIEESKKMLMAGNKDQPKILAIALDVGFNNLSSFNRAFKRHTGKTPTEYKNGRL